MPEKIWSGNSGSSLEKMRGRFFEEEDIDATAITDTLRRGKMERGRKLNPEELYRS